MRIFPLPLWLHSLLAVLLELSGKIAPVRCVSKAATRQFGIFVVILAVLPAIRLDGANGLPDPGTLDLRVPPGVSVLQERPSNVFSVLPKSLQKDPLLDIFVITEFTDEGYRRSIDAATPAIHYVAETGEYQTLGLGISHPPARMAREVVHGLLEDALSTSGFIQVDHNTTTPELLITLNWGMHIPFDDGVDHFIPQLQRQDFLERLALVGGEHWARAMATKLKTENWEEEVDAPWNPSVWNISLAQRYHRHLERIFDNVRDPRVSRLLRACREGIYFATASAYDYADFSQGKRTLLWRTKMSVPVSGVNMVETLPQLALSATPYFGRETGGPLEVPIRIIRGASVTIGEAEVIELDAPLPAGPE